MAGTLTANQIQLGDSSTASNNLVLRTNQDGTFTIARGNVGATTQDILKVNADGTLQELGRPSFPCRAWVSFDPSRNSSGGTDAANTNRFINASGNVTSVLKNGTGDYTVTMTVALPDENYVVDGSARRASGTQLIVGPKSGVAYTTTTFTVQVADATPTLTDGSLVNLIVIR